MDESLSFQHQINPALGDQLFFFIGDLAPSRLVGGAPLALHFSPRADTFLRPARAPCARACVTMFSHCRTRTPNSFPIALIYLPIIAMPRPVFLFAHSVSRKYRSSSSYPQILLKSPIFFTTIRNTAPGLLI